MTVPEVLIRPDRGRRPYRLRCRFRVEAYPSKRFLEKAKYAAAEQFVIDMAKRGFEYLPKHSFTMTGPYAPVDPTDLPKRSEQAKWHEPSRDMVAAIAAGHRPRRPADSYVKSVPLISETDKWEFELAAVFLHDTILTELPDKREETL